MYSCNTDNALKRTIDKITIVIYTETVDMIISVARYINYLHAAHAVETARYAAQ